MPELPEVETIRRALAPSLEGARIARVEILKDDLVLGGHTPGGFARAVRGRSIVEIGRRAKYLLFLLGGSAGSRGGGRDRSARRPPKPLVMRVQLRMSGKFWLGVGSPDPEEFRHPGVRFRLDDGRTLHYDDVRRLGGFDLMDRESWEAHASALGPEPLEPGFTTAALRAALGGRRAPVKNLLLDQRRVAGVGNIYASEALFRAGIDPRRPGGSLADREVAALRRTIRAVLREALRAAGTTVRSYRGVNGASGRFQTRLRVYGREGSPCRRCGAAVERTVQAGRSTFHCPDCQR